VNLGITPIRIYLAELVFLNISSEDTTKKLWEKLGNVYQSKSLVNKLFLWNKIYLLRMNDGDLGIKNLNSFNNVISWILSMDIKVLEEEKCIAVLCSFPDSWDGLVVSIRSNSTTISFEDVVSSLLSEEMR